MTARLRPLLAGVALVLLVAPALQAQMNYFGQNKIHYRDFDWRVLRGEHIDLYFYPEADELARVALAYAEESFRDLERKFGHSPQRRIPLIIYASHTDFEQTNILPFVPPEGLLGFTEFLKRRVALPFSGNYAAFRHTLRHELVHAFQLSVQTETFERHPRTNRPPLPLWFSEGLAEFWSAGEDSQDEMVLRDLTISGRLPSLQQLTWVTGGVVYPLGGAIHRWLAERYGEWRIQLVYRDLWKYPTFDQLMRGVYGRSLEELNGEWRHAFRQRYYPTVLDRQPLDVSADLLAATAVKPVAYRMPSDTTTRFLFLSPRSGYMNIYSGVLGRGRTEPRVVVKGERSAQFESFHPFASRMDVRAGVAVFTSKYLDRDALFFWDLAEEAVVGRYQFTELVSILSPAWAPDGRSVVFSGLSVGGYSDLYRVTLPDGRLEQLTRDRFEDLDPSFSPDGGRVVFASDRTTDGAGGAYNLFVLDLATRRLRYLTHGDWKDQGPRWAANERIYFTSDRDGVLDVYSVDSVGRGRRETRTLNGAFDPQWVEGENVLLFGGFADLSFSIYRSAALAPDSAGAEFTLADESASGWSWTELRDSAYARADPTPYEHRFSLDFAAGDAVVAPGVGSAQGAVFLFSDLLSDHLVTVALTSFQGDGLGGFIDNFNGAVFYLNQKRRLNWGLGGFRLKGLFYEGDFSTVFDETAFGGFAELRWPFSPFARVEGQLRLERSDRFDLVGGNVAEPRRVGWLASNYVSYVRDNALWLPTGPIDGRRLNITAGITNDLSAGRFDAWTLAIDHRQYFRVALRSAYALRTLGYYASGERPRRISIGGAWGLRGYPRVGGVAGTKAFLVNQELRFPIANFLSVGFPFGELRFPGVQGALFADVGGAWTETTAKRGVLGSAGAGLRMPVGFPLVLRLDFGYRFELGEVTGYPFSTSRGRKFVDFFFGFNY